MKKPVKASELQVGDIIRIPNRGVWVGVHFQKSVGTEHEVIAVNAHSATLASGGTVDDSFWPFDFVSRPGVSFGSDRSLSALQVGDTVRYIDVFNADNYGRFRKRTGVVTEIDENRLMVTVDFGNGERLSAMPFSFERAEVEAAIARKAPTILRREPLQALRSDPSSTASFDRALERGASWVRRNLREWPYGARLANRIEGEEVLFWFEREDA